MKSKEWWIEHKHEYMTIGDLDKPFHHPECMCDSCENWRKAKGRPTFAELEAECESGFVEYVITKTKVIDS